MLGWWRGGFCRISTHTPPAGRDEETLFGELSLENKANIAEALYSFFVIEYATNVKSYFIKVIEANFDDICDYINNEFVPNATYTSFLEKLENQKKCNFKIYKDFVQ